jgi:hypothetical protein
LSAAEEVSLNTTNHTTKAASAAIKAITATIIPPIGFAAIAALKPHCAPVAVPVAPAPKSIALALSFSALFDFLLKSTPKVIAKFHIPKKLLAIKRVVFNAC